MIPPRRAEATDDLDLVPGVLGLVAIAGEVRAAIEELAADGDGPETGDVSRLRPPLGVRDDVLDLVLGLAALARDIEERIPSGAAPAPEPREARDQVGVGELLR